MPENIPILMYHDIGEQENPWCVSPQQFELQMRWLKENGWKSISLSELKEKIEKEKFQSPNTKIPAEKLFVLTFDDGRKGVFTHALPLLRELGFSATLFVVPHWINNPQEITVEEKYSPFLNWEEVKELSCQGFEIGSHSFSHPDLTQLSTHQITPELDSAEQEILEKLQRKVQHFCYPYGKYSSEIIEEINKRYRTAVSTQRGFAKNTGAYARQWVLRDTSLEHFQKLLQKPKISLCMIVKNEEKFLDACLCSVQNIVDEIIIIDTGSTDKTKEIAQKHHAKIYDFKWIDDFAAARNFSLQQATGDWILILDADEEITSEDHQIIKEATNSWEVEGFRILTRNYSNDSTAQGWQPNLGLGQITKGLQGWFPSLKIRLFQNKKNILFQGKVHEIIPEHLLKNVASLPLSVHHYGALRGDLKEKTEMHLHLTQQKIANSDNALSTTDLAKSYFELGVQYKNLGNFTESENAFRQSLTLDTTKINPLTNLS
ncbi:polysaccharide deacetylase family protein, partial [Candidatus Woesearchaeota archaeon]|nr:polysaccharide deacetylase family protein [Candidatus Woesearchaeota archaeon]